MRTVRIGVIGARGRGAYLAAMYHRPPQAAVVAIADPNEASFTLGRERLERAQCQVTQYLRVDAMLAAERLDWVMVAAPDRTHFDLSMQALEAGCNIFVEKPMCQTVEQADRLCEMADRMGRHIVVGLELRYATPVQEFHALLRQGTIGRLIHGTCVDSVSRGYTYFLRDYRKKQWSHGLLMQKGIHSIDLINHFVGAAPVRVYASGGKDFFGRDPAARGRFCRDCQEAASCPYSGAKADWLKTDPGPRDEHARDHCVHDPDADVEDNTAVVADYANGVRLTYSEIHFTPEYQREYHFVGTAGRASLVVQQAPRPAARIVLFPRGAPEPEVREVPMTEGGHWGADERLRDALLEAMADGVAVPPDGNDGRNAVAFAAAALQSSDSGLPVTIPPRPLRDAATA